MCIQSGLWIAIPSPNVNYACICVCVLFMSVHICTTYIMIFAQSFSYYVYGLCVRACHLLYCSYVYTWVVLYQMLLFVVYSIRDGILVYIFTY